MRRKSIGGILAVALTVGVSPSVRSNAAECRSALLAQATKSEKPGELRFGKIANLDGTTKDTGDLVGTQVYLGSDGQTVFVVSYFLMSHEMAARQFDKYLREAKRVVEQPQILRKDGQPWATRAVVTLTAGPDTDPWGDNMILFLPSKQRGLYLLQSASLDDALEFERQKVTQDTNK